MCVARPPERQPCCRGDVSAAQANNHTPPEPHRRSVTRCILKPPCCAAHSSQLASATSSNLKSRPPWLAANAAPAARVDRRCAARFAKRGDDANGIEQPPAVAGRKRSPCNTVVAASWVAEILGRRSQYIAPLAQHTASHLMPGAACLPTRKQGVYCSTNQGRT